MALGAAILLVLVQFVDPRRVARVLAGARTDLVAAGLVIVVAHYAAVGWRFAAFCELFDVRVPEQVLVRTGVVSSALNRAVGFAGLVAHSMRVGVVRLWGGRARDVVAAAVLNQAFQALLTPALTVVGLVLVFGVPGLAALPSPRSLLSTGGIVILAALLGLLLLATRLGPWLSSGIEQVYAWLTAGRLGEGVEQVRATVALRAGQIREDPALLARPGMYMVLEPLTSLTVLFLAFWAIDHPLPPGHILLTYAAVGWSALVSFVPGNLGIREGSMAGVLAWLGVPWESALAGVLLYRAMIDWLPALLALPLAYRLLPRTRQATG